jgi:hypothetical protein
MSWTEADPRNIFGSVTVKAEGESVTDSWTYKAAGRYTDALTRSQLSIQEGDRTIVVSEMLLRLEYILQRTVPNYDELVNQFNAIKDIERSNNDIR